MKDTSIQRQKVLLLIIDGWGISKRANVSAIKLARTPFYDSLINKYPNTALSASGKEVGLPLGVFGNSEVGHINIGAGRVVKQTLEIINDEISSGRISTNITLRKALDYSKLNNSALHLVGLVSNGGIHSHLDHLKALITEAHQAGLTKVYIHAITDGRDTSPHSSIDFLRDIESHCKKKVGKISTIIGRYYAMDRDKRWDRTKKAYDLLINKTGKVPENWVKEIDHSYQKGITDEFLEPIVLPDFPGIDDHDSILFFNYRTDRLRQLVRAMSQPQDLEYSKYNMTPLNLNYYTFTEYDQSFKGIDIILENEKLNNTLGEVISKNGLRQLRIAETEKYPHVTYFFSGGRERPFKNEDRILCPSPKVTTYDLKPEMSIWDITKNVISEINNNKYEFICANLANPDMVGHTGNLDATIAACENVDESLKSIIETSIDNGYITYLCSDHGNADVMKDDEGQPLTSHTLNKVPLILIGNTDKSLKEGKLADIAPTILSQMGIKIPNEMNGNILLIDE